VPRGTYLLSGHDGPYALERFSCAPGPAGWRYVATREQPGTGALLGRLDLVLDARGAPVRVQVETGGWVLRGGVVGAQALWRRGPDERGERAVGFTGTSPAWAVAAARLLAAAPAPAPAPAPVRLRLVRLGDEALSTRLVEESWAHTGTATREGLVVVRYETADLGTGERRVVHLSGDVVLDAPDTVLLDLDGPL